jgi:hypothetical protein
MCLVSRCKNGEKIMHVTELSESHINELKEYIEINELGHIITKKKNVIKSDVMKNGICGGSRTKIGKRRGTKTKYGHTFSFKFPSNNDKIVCKAREIVWILNSGVYDATMKVKPINGDLFDDRLENLHLKKRNNGRPPKSKDLKRRTRNQLGLSKKEINTAIELKKKGFTWSEISKKTNYSVATLQKWVRTHPDFKPAFNSAILNDKKKYDLENIEEECGIYCLAMHPTGFDDDNNMSKFYIGSSVNIKKRIQGHLLSLRKNKHYNREFQDCFNNCMQFNAYFLEHCDENNLLTKEEEWRSKYCEGSLLNKNKAPTLEEMKPWLERAKKCFTEDKYTVNEETGCWEWNVLDGKPSGGYGNSISISVNTKVKYIIPHRLSYYIHKGEYPELVRHICNNKCCVNPHHLEAGSHRQNNLDVYKEFDEEFEYWWLRYGADPEKLTKHFNYKPNATVKNRNYSNQIYYFEKKLGLREKYSDVIERHELRR